MKTVYTKFLTDPTIHGFAAILQNKSSDDICPYHKKNPYQSSDKNNSKAISDGSTLLSRIKT